MAEQEAPPSETQVPRRDAPLGDLSLRSALLSLILAVGWYTVIAVLYLVAFFTHR